MILSLIFVKIQTELLNYICQHLCGILAWCVKTKKVTRISPKEDNRIPNILKL